MNMSPWYLILRVLLGLALLAGTSVGWAQPVNDMFANATVISGTNVSVGGNNVNATKEAGEPNHAGDTGGHSVWWVWTAPKTDFATVSTTGSSFDTLLAVYTGSTVSALIRIESNDDDADAGTRTSKLSFAATVGQTYRIAVDGWNAESGTIQLQLKMGPLPPPPPAPAWTLLDPWGNVVRSTDFAAKVVMVNFWGTTCPPCLAEMPDMVDLQTKYRADGFEIVGADVSWWHDTPQGVIGFLSSFTPTINYQVVMSTPANEAAFGGILAVPTTFIIDRQNLIRKKFVGSQSFASFEQNIIPWLYNTTQLESERTGPNELTLRWPANMANFSLESAPTLLNPTWSTWPTPPTILNGSNTVTVPISGARLFRLRMPY